MIDYIIKRYPYVVYLSDIRPYESYIGYESENGSIVFY